MDLKGIKLEVRDVGGKSDVKLILIDGALDVLTSAQAERVISPLIDSSKHLILDCTNLLYLNTAGLVTLMKFSTKMKKKNGDFKIVNPTELVYEILDLAGMFNFFESYHNQEDAIKSIREGA